MIKVENIDVWGWEHAIRGMRNPMNSWDKSDTSFDMITGKIITMGEKDLELMHNLYEAGSSHRKFMRQLFVSMDITAPLYWWKEFDTYKVGTVANSCSTMHKLMEKEFEIDDFSHDKMNTDAEGVLNGVIRFLNMQRDIYLNGIHGQMIGSKEFWWNIIQLLPSSYNQRRTITMNYENVVNICQQRKGHKLDEWRQFVEILSELPYLERIVTGK